MIAPPRQKRTPRPLDAARLDELALAYVARFAVSAAKLETYLKRKLRERGWAEETDAPVNEVVARCVRAGYVDDALYARMKGESLLRRGYGPRRVAQVLDAAGVAMEQRPQGIADGATDGATEDSGVWGEAGLRRAALAYARRRRIGPYNPPVDRAVREKQLAALLRAGHRRDLAHAVLALADPDRAQEWLDAAEEI